MLALWTGDRLPFGAFRGDGEKRQGEEGDLGYLAEPPAAASDPPLSPGHRLLSRPPSDQALTVNAHAVSLYLLGIGVYHGTVGGSAHPRALS